MSAGASSSRATEVISEAVDGELTLLPAISSARKRYVTVRMRQRINNRLGSKSQPELNRRKELRVSSKLCSTVSMI